MEQKQNIKKAPKKNNWFKKNWHIIVICVLLFFGMSQCVNRCTNGNKVRTKNAEIEQRDSIINVLNIQIDTLRHSLNYYTALYSSEKSHNANFANIATGNQAELYSKINELEATVSRLQNENKSLRKRITELEEKN